MKKPTPEARKPLFIVLISVHGLIRGDELELGRDADTGGQTKYVVDLARALGERADVEKVVLLTRRIIDDQIDADYAEPFEALSEKVGFWANKGADILRLDAVAFLWKKMGSVCQNEREAHLLLQLMKDCCQVTAPGVLFIAEAIVAPAEIAKYFGEDAINSKECEIAYNASFMALLWDGVATKNAALLNRGLKSLPIKLERATWLNYVRCHDDIASASTTTRTRGRARKPERRSHRCGGQNHPAAAQHDPLVRRDPLLYYGDAVGMLNNKDYLNDPFKRDDNRWMHRSHFDWDKAKRRHQSGTVEHRIFCALKKLIALRKETTVFVDTDNRQLLALDNLNLLAFSRTDPQNSRNRVLVIGNFNVEAQTLPVSALTPYGYFLQDSMKDLCSGTRIAVENDMLVLPPLCCYWLTD